MQCQGVPLPWRQGGGRGREGQVGKLHPGLCWAPGQGSKQKEPEALGRTIPSSGRFVLSTRHSFASPGPGHCSRAAPASYTQTQSYLLCLNPLQHWAAQHSNMFSSVHGLILRSPAKTHIQSTHTQKPQTLVQTLHQHKMHGAVQKHRAAILANAFSYKIFQRIAKGTLLGNFKEQT